MHKFACNAYASQDHNIPFSAHSAIYAALFFSVFFRESRKWGRVVLEYLQSFALVLSGNLGCQRGDLGDQKIIPKYSAMP
ncbi:uncharacterized protein LAJ45_08291 [Morchella importuna]|uniref:uncharacterized protein n=1 Tax=Morchella importuna TaxID=1174673 RepID=UPI001E8E8F26|nr:uncharacterized protein LAJ45_08291 [Morchella importuna]KAH8147825.1 hypothetical protein LAJ45_08291 [Morchella importuna]